MEDSSLQSKPVQGRGLWDREELIWGVVKTYSREILSGSCRTDFVVRPDGSLAQFNRAAAAAMPGIEKLPIEETLEDSPQVTTLFLGGFR